MTSRHPLLLALVLVFVPIFVGPALAQEEAGSKRGGSGEQAREDALHAPWDALLKAHVQDGLVSYRGFQRDEAKLDRYLKRLARAKPESLSEDGRLALWINAYNAYTVKLILRRYPEIESVKDISSRWDLEDWTVGGRKLSLGDIEHEILRVDFEEPRIHFAINCASMSCPELRAEAYVPSRIDEQLEAQTRRFLADETKGLKTQTEPGALWGENHWVYLSKIFSWFDDDFEEASGSVLDYVRPSLEEEDARFFELHEGDLSETYFDYDWSLNEVPGERE